MRAKLRTNGVHPFLRWAGGKSWLINTVHQLIQDVPFTNYYEPFLGGGAIFFSLPVKNGTALLSDANKELIDTYIAVRDNPDAVIQHIRKYVYSEEFYYDLRAQEPKELFERAARFIYLNHTSYNGLYRVNKQGKYNVPYGHKKNVKIDLDGIRAASNALQGCVLTSGDFENRVDAVSKDTLVFLDPPYTVSHNNNGFISYNQHIFSIEDQRRLAEYIKYIDSVGAYFILTNAAHDAIREIFGECGRVIEVERQSLIGGKNARRGLAQELVFTNITAKEC